jgi:hypothetical protein
MADCAPVAGKSTLNRLKLSRETATRYHEISHEPSAIEALFVDLFLEAHAKAPKQIILDLDATGPRAQTRGPAAWPSGRPILPRRLRLLLLPAALCILRPASAGGQAPAAEHRRQRRRGRGSCANHRADPGALAENAHPAARRFRVRPRGADGVV